MRLTRILILLSALLLSVWMLVSCESPTPSGTVLPPTRATTESAPVDPEAFIAALDEAAASPGVCNCAFVADWLREHVENMPGFTHAKLTLVENYYRKYFIRDVGDTSDVAKKVCSLVSDCLKEGLFDPNDRDVLTDYLIACYLEAVGDKYASYMNAESYALYATDTDGNYVGIGVTVHYLSDADGLEVIAVTRNSPAETAGIRVGDVITEVDGENVMSLGYYGAIAKVRGEEGTPVTLTVMRGEEKLTMICVRAALVEETVTYEMLESAGKKIGYIRISSFDGVTADQFIEAVDALTGDGAEGLVFDLRNNGGGLLSAILTMTDYLLPDGRDLVSFLYYDDSTDSEPGSDGHSVDLPFAVLCNGHTASAAELFTSSLRDYDDWGLIDATVVGELTYGKGTMQTLVTFTDGSAMTISIAYYNPPCGTNYEGIGITPDNAVSNDPLYDGVDPADLPEGCDLQLAAALALFAADPE